MANLTSFTGGAGTPENTFVASGTISSGDLVSLNSDGTVSVTTGLGLTPTTFNSANSYDMTATYDALNNKVVVAYRDNGNSDYGTAVVGTVSGTSISFGTPVVFNAATTEDIYATFDATNNKVVLTYIDGGNSRYGTAIVGTVSGTSISFGTPAVFHSVPIEHPGVAFDTTNGKVVVAYKYSSSGGYSAVGTVSGTSISFGTPVQFEASSVEYPRAVYDSNAGKIVIMYRENSVYGIVGTVSGTSISFGTRVEAYGGTGTASYDAIFDSNVNKVVFVFRGQATSYPGTAVVGTVSGTSISFGSSTEFNSEQAYIYDGAVFNPSDNKVYVVYRENGGDFYGAGYIKQGTISGDTISFGPATLIDVADQSSQYASVYDPDTNQIVISYLNNTDSEGQASVYNPASNIFDWIGVSTADITDGNEGAITTLGGINTGQSGLTAKSKYYLQNDATISTTEVTGREVGRATSATSIFVTKGGIV